MNKQLQKSSAFIIFMAGIFTSACSDTQSDSEGRTLPTDEQVVADVMPKDKKNVVDIYTTKGKSGEAYLDKKSLVWTFDRGVVIKRKKKVAGAPDAVVVVSGLARYMITDNSYDYRKFLVTDNSYEGIPQPSKNDLLGFVNNNLNKVFNVTNSITEVSSVALEKDAAWIWHSATSFSVPFKIYYKKITSVTTVETRAEVIRIRFYRSNIHSPVNNLLASTQSRELLGTQQFEAGQIKAMLTLQDKS